MTVYGYIRGHRWTQTPFGKRWSESGELEESSTIRKFRMVQQEGGSVPCTRCGEPPTKEGYDKCLGHLPGVTAGCCGHGVEPGYIQFRNGLIIRGYFKVEKDEEAGL